MMYRNALIQYGANDVFSSVCLPFGSGDKYRMYVLLPSEGKSVDDVVNVLTNDFWEKNRPVGNAVVDLKLPRFKTNSDIRLNDLISQLGAPSMFDSEKADFAGISKNYKDLYVSLLKQKAAIEVSEEGTKASAVTVAMIDTTSGPMDYKKATFHADRPFVYLIQEWDTRAVFFIGTYEGDL
jgi:serpin B